MPSSGILAFELNMNDDIWKSYSAIILRIEHFLKRKLKKIYMLITTRKHYGYEKLYRGFRRKNFVCNLSAGKLIISAAVAGGITLNPAVMATLTGVGLLLKTVASLKKNHKKKQKKPILPVSNTKKILDDIRFYLRGETFDERVFLDKLKMKDNFVTDYCMEIPQSISKKYEKKFAPL